MEKPSEQLKAEVEKQGVNPAEHDGLFDAACRMLDAAASADDPALLAARDDFQRLAFDPASPVSESYRMALMNAIANVTSRMETEQRGKAELVAQQANTDPAKLAAQAAELGSMTAPLQFGDKTDRVADERAQPNKGSGRGAA
ncbi:MAG: hypothetical protein ACN2B6_06250 [Rickettsiales bacterium]